MGDQMQHCGMPGVVQVGHGLVSPVDRQGVLDEVVGANGDEIEVLEKGVDVDRRRTAEPLVAALRLTGAVRPMLPAIEVQDGYFAFPRAAGHDALRAAFDAAFNTLVDAGALKKLGQRLDVNTP